MWLTVTGTGTAPFQKPIPVLVSGKTNRIPVFNMVADIFKIKLRVILLDILLATTKFFCLKFQYTSTVYRYSIPVQYTGT
jgi:hypothetical protein